MAERSRLYWRRKHLKAAAEENARLVEIKELKQEMKMHEAFDNKVSLSRNSAAQAPLSSSLNVGDQHPFFCSDTHLYPTCLLSLWHFQAVAVVHMPTDVAT